MAGDWLKMEINTPDKPEVIGMADMLGVNPAHVVGGLFMVWRWFDQQTTDGNASFVTKITVDRISGVTGFADAMEKVGWLVAPEDGGLVLPNFVRHNGETAKQRALTAKRVAKSKAKSNEKSNATVTQQVTQQVTGVALPREEKRREELTTSVPNGTDGKPSKVTDPNEIIFGYGVPLLTSAGIADKQARSFLGGLRKHHGDDALIEKLRQCLREKPLQPLEWLAAALPPPSSGGSGKRSSIHEERERNISRLLSKDEPGGFILEGDARRVG